MIFAIVRTMRAEAGEWVCHMKLKTIAQIAGCSVDTAHRRLNDHLEGPAPLVKMFPYEVRGHPCGPARFVLRCAASTSKPSPGVAQNAAPPPPQLAPPGTAECRTATAICGT